MSGPDPPRLLSSVTATPREYALRRRDGSFVSETDALGDVLSDGEELTVVEL